jgi:hypothetical protein
MPLEQYVHAKRLDTPELVQDHREANIIYTVRCDYDANHGRTLFDLGATRELPTLEFITAVNPNYPS